MKHSKSHCFLGADPEFGQGGPQLLRPKVANVSEWSRASEVSYLWLGSRAHLRALKAFNAQICILPHSRDTLISDIYIKTKNLQFSLNEE